MAFESHELDNGVRTPVPHLLPLTESVDGRSRTLDDAYIEALVAGFYDTVRHDELLGPIFEERVNDWSVHLARMREFWSTVVNHSGRYTGRPLEVHMRIPGLTDAHFGRWLELWNLAVETHLPQNARAPFAAPAMRMAQRMAQRYGKQEAQVRIG